MEIINWNQIQEYWKVLHIQMKFTFQSKLAMDKLAVAKYLKMINYYKRQIDWTNFYWQSIRPERQRVRSWN